MWAAGACTLVSWFLAGWYWLARRRMPFWPAVARLQRAVCLSSVASVLFLAACALLAWWGWALPSLQGIGDVVGRGRVCPLP